MSAENPKTHTKAELLILLRVALRKQGTQDAMSPEFMKSLLYSNIEVVTDALADSVRASLNPPPRKIVVPPPDKTSAAFDLYRAAEMYFESVRHQHQVSDDAIRLEMALDYFYRTWVEHQ